MEIKKPEEIVALLAPIIPNWQLLGYGPEIIQYQEQSTYKVLTLRSVKWEQVPNTTEISVSRCPWYVTNDLHGPDYETKKLITKALE